MKCVILFGFVTLLGQGYGNVLRCSIDGNDDPCASEEEKAPPAPLEVESEKTECLAGSEWESNCHYCRCAESGVAECLKQESCDDGVFSEPIQCKPNTTFQRDCNTCVCLESGLALCTIQFCRKFRRIANDKSELPSGKECAPGSTWKSRCNACTCTPSGYAACTEAVCGEQETKPEIRCAPDTTWKNDCNTCWCTSEGRAMCTKVGCVTFTDSKIEDDNEDKEFINGPNTSLVRTVRAAQEAPYKTCQPGQEFRLDCNKCLCDNLGEDFSCTRIDCNALNNQHNDGGRTKREVSNLEEVTANCTPGSTFEQGCNACKCTADGRHALCSNKKCTKENPPTTDVHSSDADPGFRCNPGEQFKKDCNDCTCSADGRSTFCTLRLCDQDITPGI